MRNQNRGITLLALVITIIVLVILAGVSINLVLGQNGIVNRGKEAKETYAEQQAREKLEMELANLFADKELNSEYNEEQYLTKKLEEKGFIVNEDIVLVDEWQFQIDRSVPKIGASLGKGNRNEEIKLTVSQTVSPDYVKSTIKAEIEYNKEIDYVQMAGEKREGLEKGADGKYTLEKDVTENGTYMVYVRDKEGNYNIASIKVEDVTEDLIIRVAEDLVKFRDNVNSGRTYEGREIKVVQDIDLSTVCGQNINTSWETIGNETHTFKGTFHGNNHQINHLYISNNTQNYVGLFGFVAGASIDGIQLAQGSVNGTTNAGGIVGYATGSTISNCSNSATTITVKTNYGGGICGIIANHTNITYCYNLASITGAHGAGGIARRYGPEIVAL